MKSIIRISFVLSMLAIFIQPVFSQKKVKNFTAKHVINAPIDKVWTVIADDYGAIAHSHPKIVSSDYMAGTLQGGEGAERICYFNEKGSRYLKEKIMEYDPENYTFKNQVYEAGKFPVNPKYTFAYYKLEKIDDNTTRLVFDMTYRTKPAFMGGMMKKQFKKLISDYAIAIDHHVNTGESVTKSNFKSVKKKYKSAK